MKSKARRRRPENWVALHAFGEALLKFAETGNDSCLRRSVINLAHFARCIIQIAEGKDARELFGQTGVPGRQSESVYNSTRVWVYWQSRCDSPSDIDRAVKRAQESVPSKSAPMPNREVIMRNARRYRDKVLKSLAYAGIDTKPIEKYLAQKAKRGKS